MTTSAHLYILETVADGEPGYIWAELNSSHHFAEPGISMPVRMAGATVAPIRTLAGGTSAV